MGKLFRFLGGTVIGTAIGAGAAMLLAPQSGKDLQHKLQARREEAIAAARATTATRERELRAEWEARVSAETIKRRALHGRDV
ncbi:MAG: YtxH domain-containing protein [Chloroflexota bacterium]|nr:YtxH domain-containing protein [Chloroflexota bacterium]